MLTRVDGKSKWENTNEEHRTGGPLPSPSLIIELTEKLVKLWPWDFSLLII